MGFQVNGEVIISSSGDIDNVGVATMGLVDAKVSAKAITRQDAGDSANVTEADELLLHDSETGRLLRVTVTDFTAALDLGGTTTVDAGDFNSGSSTTSSSTEINGGDFS